MKVTKRKIKLYSDQIIDAIFSQSVKNRDLEKIFSVLKPHVNAKVDFIGMSTTKETKIHRIDNHSVGTMTFRIAKPLAKKIGLYPYNKRTYKITFKELFLLSELKSRTPHHMSNPDNLGLIKQTLHFSSISHKDVKKFELPKLLTWIYKLDNTIFLKIEKVLFEKTG